MIDDTSHSHAAKPGKPRAPRRAGGPAAEPCNARVFEGLWKSTARLGRSLEEMEQAFEQLPIDEARRSRMSSSLKEAKALQERLSLRVEELRSRCRDVLGPAPPAGSPPAAA